MVSFQLATRLQVLMMTLVLAFVFGFLGALSFVVLILSLPRIAKVWGSLSDPARATIKVVLDLVLIAPALWLIGVGEQGLSVYYFGFLAAMVILGGYRMGTESPSWQTISIIVFSSLLGFSFLLLLSEIALGNVFELHMILVAAIVIPSLLLAIRLVLVAMASYLDELVSNSLSPQQTVLLVPSLNKLLLKLYIDVARARGHNLQEVWVIGNCAYTYIDGVPIKRNIRELPRLKEEKPLLLVVEAELKAEPLFTKIVDQARTSGCDLIKVNATKNGFSENPLTSFELNEIWVKLFRDERQFELDPTKSSVRPDSPIVITGGAGSIGSTLVNTFLSAGFSNIHVVDISEAGIYSLTEEFESGVESGKLKTYLLDIRDEIRIQKLFRELRPEAVFHAAACKHVPIVEFNPGTAFENNVLGTFNLLRSLPTSTVQFTLISTDKAVYPTNFMGATKRMAESLVSQAAQQDTRKICRYSVVRFGNVFGSSGSAPLKFIKQITEGKKVTLTDDRMKRYFMSINEACYLVARVSLDSEEITATGGESLTYVLEMGEMILVLDLLKALVELSGKRIVAEPKNSGEIAIEVIGPRPGEKLFEELAHDDDLVASRIPGVRRVSRATKNIADLDIEFADVFKDRRAELGVFLDAFNNLQI